MIKFSNISFYRGSKKLFDDASLTIYHGQHLGVVGVNGAGKSSFFSLLNGENLVDAGTFNCPRDLAIAFTRQEQEGCVLQRTALDFCLDGDELLRNIETQIHTAEQSGDCESHAYWLGEYDAHQGYTSVARAEKLLAGLGFQPVQFAWPVAKFSGGWRMRLNLARTLMKPADLLLLDEPTNHLDLDAIIWLEHYLKNYQGTLLVISHDQDFLDACVQYVVHIHNQKFELYRGNYSFFEKKRAQVMAQQEATRVKQEKVREKMQSYVDRFRAKASKAKQAQSRLKAMQRLQTIAPLYVNSKFSFSFVKPNVEEGIPLIQLTQANLGYADKPIVHAGNFCLRAGSKIALLGMNGVGKSTLMKTLAGKLTPLSGEISRQAKLVIGYFSQHQMDSLDPLASPLVHLHRLSPSVSDQELRGFLGRFGFSNDKSLSPVATFSGGEAVRLTLALIAWQKPNLLLLDEPTNHLDFDMRFALTTALQDFSGAILLVSHDRRLIRTLVDEFFYIQNAKLERLSAGLDGYTKISKGIGVVNIKEKIFFGKENAENKPQNREKKLHKKHHEVKKIRIEVNRLERSIEQSTEKILRIEKRFLDPEIYQSKNQNDLSSLLEEKKSLQHTLNILEEEWMAQQALLDDKTNTS